MEMESIDRLMRQAIAEKIFPGGVLLVSKKGETVFFSAYGVTHLVSRAPVSSETIFDLASLTKPLATTLAVMRLVQHNQIKLEQHLGQLLPEFEHTDKARVKLEHLLYHNSGLPDYRPYYEALKGIATDSCRKALRKPAGNMASRTRYCLVGNRSSLSVHLSCLSRAQSEMIETNALPNWSVW